MIKGLQYRRQFLLSRGPLQHLPDWQCVRMGQYYLYAHPDLKINHNISQNSAIAILGDIFDPYEPNKSNSDILQDLISTLDSFEELICRLKKYAGCFAILFHLNNSTIILHDARGLREIYYCTSTNQIICGSQPNLIAKFSCPVIIKSIKKDLLSFFESHLWDSRWVGEETYFSGIQHLLPNHYLDVERLEVRRYWPNESIPSFSLEEAAKQISLFLQGIMKAIVHRHPVMMAITAGTDSRTLLAASKDLLHKIYFFINDHNLGAGNPDISVPQSIFESIGVPFHIHKISGAVNEHFRDLYFLNTHLASDRLLPSIYDIFIRNQDEKIQVLGVSEIGRTFYGKAPKRLTSYRMAYKLGYKNSHYALSQCKNILPEIQSTSKKFGLNAMILLYWEQRLGNWGATRNSESLIAIEKIDPFNSHNIYELFLSVEEKYRNYKHTPPLLFREIIRSMWPALLEWPINPPRTIEDKFKSFIVKMGLFNQVAEIKYRLSYIKHIISRRCNDLWK